MRKLTKGANSAQITLEASLVLQDMKIGDSIAVNGVCLTVVQQGNHFFVADMMAETLGRSNLGQLQLGAKVNLERALALGDRLGGHLVSGHIDAVGTILRKEKQDIAILITIAAPSSLLKYVVPKGSIAVDGASLTVVDVNEKNFQVSLIPHTAQCTTLGYKENGDTVNLEGDMLGKYVERLLWAQSTAPAQKKKDLTFAFLAEHGFS